MKRCRALALAVVLVPVQASLPGRATAYAQPRTGQYRMSSGQIVESCGTIGNYTVGKTIDGRNEKRQPNSDEYVSADGIVITTNSRRVVTELRVSSPGAFTQRYVVIQEARLNDVLNRYGRPQPRQQRGRRTSSDFVLEYAYDGVSFVFAGVPANLTISGSSVPPQFNRPVTAVIVHEKERDPSGRSHSCGLTSKPFD